MTLRYLYGKKEHLAGLISGRKLPRLSDISHYKRMENDSMRDEEEKKEFSFDKDVVKIKINNFELNASDFFDHPKISIPVRHCYCVCFSKRKNDAELFNLFKADVCIEIDMDVLKDELDLIFSDRFSGTEIEFRDVEYFHQFQPLFDKSSSDLVFCKPSAFIHEQETRLAFFYPVNKKGFKGSGGKILPFRIEGESLHLEINISDENTDAKSQCVTGVYYLNSAFN
ncbi:Uncharacterised protein [Aeromonas salmonicida]|uniref:hypothetical protein n=1 Tax=Aeromonas salmonicida TaxID=645 RepID=UPI001024F30D|nr:hypothetical protein [Aeromonas salmonicida]VFB08924.1 Uncharacterised protein [Aeromonas salmonicida]